MFHNHKFQRGIFHWDTSSFFSAKNMRSSVFWPSKNMNASVVVNNCLTVFKIRHKYPVCIRCKITNSKRTVCFTAFAYTLKYVVFVLIVLWLGCCCSDADTVLLIWITYSELISRQNYRYTGLFVCAHKKPLLNKHLHVLFKHTQSQQ